MNTHNICLIFGAAFAAVGILGVIPNPIISETGFFATNTIHNMIHVALGFAFTAGALKFPGHESLLLKLLGVGGIAVAALGFVGNQDTLLWMVHVNPADHWLHLGLALLVLASGFLCKDRAPRWNALLLDGE